MIDKNRHHTAKSKHEIFQIHSTGHDTFKVFKKNLIYLKYLKFRRNADCQKLLRRRKKHFSLPRLQYDAVANKTWLATSLH